MSCHDPLFFNCILEKKVKLVAPSARRRPRPPSRTRLRRSALVDRTPSLPAPGAPCRIAPPFSTSLRPAGESSADLPRAAGAAGHRPSPALARTHRASRRPGAHPKGRPGGPPGRIGQGGGSFSKKKKMNVAHHYDDSMEETDLASSKKFNIKTTLVSNKE